MNKFTATAVSRLERELRPEMTKRRLKLKDNPRRCRRLGVLALKSCYPLDFTSVLRRFNNNPNPNPNAVLNLRTTDLSPSI